MITNNKDENIIYDAENYLKIWLKKWEELKIKASTWKTTIKILEWSPVEVNWELVMKTFSSESMDFDIKNLWGYSLVELSTENKFEKNYKSYKIIKKVWNNFVIKERWKVY
jgi:hypothetical protein